MHCNSNNFQRIEKIRCDSVDNLAGTDPEGWSWGSGPPRNIRLPQISIPVQHTVLQP